MIFEVYRNAMLHVPFRNNPPNGSNDRNQAERLNFLAGETDLRNKSPLGNLSRFIFRFREGPLFRLWRFSPGLFA